MSTLELALLLGGIAFGVFGYLLGLRRRRLHLEEKEFYRSLSFLDSLTGLYNQRRFYELLAYELSRARRYSHPLALLMIDIDGFKEYQDAHGHLSGDAALKQFAETLKGLVREVDIVARYGGEEFAMILLETTREEAVRAAERIRAAASRSRLPSGERLTVSIGIAGFPQDAKDKEKLISLADSALYQAKREGRNRTCLWSPPEEAQVDNRSPSVVK